MRIDQGLEHIDALTSMKWSGFATSITGGIAFLAQATTAVPTEVGSWVSAGSTGLAAVLLGYIFGKLLPDMFNRQDAKDKLFADTLKEIQGAHSKDVDKVVAHCKEEMEKVEKRADSAAEIKLMLAQLQRQAPRIDQ